jgi:two-component system sensor histidine kinase SenX3
VIVSGLEVGLVVGVAGGLVLGAVAAWAFARGRRHGETVTNVAETEALDAVRRDFVANVSHELKTPIGALQLLAEALSEGATDPAVTRDFAQRIQREAQRLGRLVQDLLELSRLEGAAAQPPLQPTSVDAVIREALDCSALAAEAAGVTVVVPPRTGLFVAGDESQLVTAVGNLLDNAITYSPRGSTVRVDADAGDETVRLSVVDEGIGISEADAERVFERFYRVDPARSRVTGGTGLGLAIVKHIAANHGGHVTVASERSAGSTFTLHLPTAGVM